MNLKRVTITGADDQVDPQALIELSAEFPFVEWAFLVSKSKVGSPRYPKGWLRIIERLHGKSKTAVHLCGEIARAALSGDVDLTYVWHYSRVQLNGFSAYRLPGLRIANGHPEIEFILQCSNIDALDHAGELAELHPNVSALWDMSGGKGVECVFWPSSRPGLRLGYAGGITPDNVEQLLSRPLSHIDPIKETWIDMESGVRTDDCFDIEKVRRVLELAAPFVVKEPPKEVSGG